MSTEWYSHPEHLNLYAGPMGDCLHQITLDVDQLLYPDTASGRPVLGKMSAQAGTNVTSIGFRYTYLRSDTWTRGFAVESMTLSIDHAIHIGRQALKQSYKLRTETSLQQTILRGNGLAIPPENRVTSLYYIEQYKSDSQGPIFTGSQVRPNIMGEEHPADELMTVYDCNWLSQVIGEVAMVAEHDMHTTDMLSAIIPKHE